MLEAHLPDVVLFHVTASDEEIARRMQDSPHEYPVVREEHIAEVKARFEEEIAASLFTHQRRTIVLDTTDKTPEESFDELLLQSEPLVTMGELAVRNMEVPRASTKWCTSAACARWCLNSEFCACANSVETSLFRSVVYLRTWPAAERLITNEKFSTYNCVFSPAAGFRL